MMNAAKTSDKALRLALPPVCAQRSNSSAAGRIRTCDRRIRNPSDSAPKTAENAESLGNSRGQAEQVPAVPVPNTGTLAQGSAAPGATRYSWTECQAGRDLDKLIAERFMRVPGKRKHIGTMVPPKIFKPRDIKHTDDWNRSDDWHFISSGHPPRTHMIDCVQVPNFSKNDAWGISLLRLWTRPAILTRHGDHREGWTCMLTVPSHEVERFGTCMAHAICLAMLAASEDDECKGEIRGAIITGKWPDHRFSTIEDDPSPAPRVGQSMGRGGGE